MNLKRLLWLKALSGKNKTNLLDPSLIEMGYYTSSGNKTQDNDDRYRRFAITLPAGSYTFGTDLPNCYIIRVLIDNVADGSGGAMQERPTVSTSAPLLPCTKNQVERLGFFIAFLKWVLVNLKQVCAETSAKALRQTRERQVLVPSRAYRF